MMKTFLILVLVLATSCSADIDSEFNWKLQLRQELSCEERKLDCERCLRQESCTWCGADDKRSSSCISSDICPSSLQHSSCPDKLDLEEQLDDLYENKRVVILDTPLVTFNASYLCQLRQKCADCTAMGFCAWCENKKLCVPFSGALTTTLCGSKSWSKNHCVPKGARNQQVTPCPHRSSGCKECLADDKCYWCESTKHCDFYPGDGIKPKNCSNSDWFYRSCYKIKGIVVFIPILMIIATPFIAYIVMYCMLCIMRKAGYDAIDDTDSSDDEDKKRKPIMLRHDSPGGKTDQLRKKYNLDKKP